MFGLKMKHLIVVVLIIWAVFLSIVFWNIKYNKQEVGENQKVEQEVNNKQKTVSEPKLTTKEKCFQSVKGLDDNQLLTSALVDGNKFLNDKKKLLEQYFACKIDTNNINTYAENVNIFISNNKIESRFKEFFNEELEPYTSLNSIIAFGDLTDFDSPGMAEYIKKEAVRDGFMKWSTVDNYWLENVYEIMTELFNNDKFFKANILDLQFVYLDDLDSYKTDISKKKTERLKNWKTAVAYRKGGEELAYKICNGFEGGEKEYCVEYIKSGINNTSGLDNLKRFKEEKENCEKLVNNFVNRVCE